MAPSTFASAAAGSNQNPSQARDGGSEWTRRPNGATQTFRRTSNATTTSAANPHNDPAAASLSSQPPRYVPPHRNGAMPDTRYSKNQLLDLFKQQQDEDGGLRDDLQDLFVGGWYPDMGNGAPSVTWGRHDHNRDPPPGPDVCWDRDGNVEPLSLTGMDDEERELFLTSVNTPLKPPTQNKENQQSNGLPGRKISVSHNVNSPGGYGVPSPSATRGSARRRGETGESYPFPNPVSSPTGGFNRDEQRAPSPPPSLLRRRTDMKDLGKGDDHGEDKPATTPFGSLKRNPTGPLSAGITGPSSPWSNAPQSAGFSPMGSFGNFGIGGTASQQGTPSEKRTGLGNGRAESRFKNLLQKDSNEDIGGRSVERKTSMSNLPKVNENESWARSDRANLAGAPLDEAEEDAPLPSGSAALAAGSDLSPPQSRQVPRGFDTPSRAGTRDEFGFGAFGMTSDNSHGFGHGLLQGQQQTPAHSRMGLQPGGNEPMSPTDTNPFKSPEQHGISHLREGAEHEGHDMQNSHLPGLGGFGGDHMQQHAGLGGLGTLPNLGRPGGPQGPASDRSQTSSIAPGRGFPQLGGLGQLGGMPGASAWPVGQGGLGTPGRQAAGMSNAFGGGIFGNPMGDVQSPSLAGLGGGSIMSPQPGNEFGGSRMSSLFPQGMQDQMRQGERDMSGERPGQSQLDTLGSLGLGDNENAFQGQGFSDMQRSQEGDQKQGDASQPLGSSASNQPPAPQQRTMVMPDRMRWIYRDPQGQTQGPWSGLEMHDWYKAGFFSPELLVKKAEDVEYEPLAQLIRRIGNSREPFLVPQIGIPHGSASTQGPWSSGIPAPAGPTSSGGAQPPFASSFPSFGTTLTADQQNALERRKQEEQYLMARQKEHLAQAQIAQRMQHIQGGHSNISSNQMVGQLHHQTSAQSLNSQPSFGSMTSPSAYQPSPSQGPSSGQPGFFDNSFRAPQGGLGAVGAGVDSLGHIREEEIPGIMDRLNLGNRAPQANQFGAPGQPPVQQQMQQSPQDSHAQQVQRMLQDRVRLQEEQARQDAAEKEQPEQQASNDRLQQFQQLQGQDQAQAPGSGLEARFQAAINKTSGAEKSEQQAAESTSGAPAPAPAPAQQPQEQLSLTEQVQKAASAKQSPAPAQSAWAKVEPSLPQPFPPAPSQSPLPAPAAQRTSRQSVADHLHAESRSRSQTPSVDTPSTTVAPWAREPAEPTKGPSLKEIQQAEAQQAAEKEKFLAAKRKADLQKEMEAQALAAAAAAAPAPGLPTSSTWAASEASPATPTGGSAWAKAAQPKPTATAAKSMAQIQKEEENRKKRQAAAALQAQQASANIASVPSPAGGKSYANLAGKVSSPAPQAPAGPPGAWTTVGAGGKTKAPAAPSPAPGHRTPSAAAAAAMQPPAAARKAPSRSSTLTGSGAVNAQEEFKKWATAELRVDLNKSINVDDFVASLISLPADAELITEAVHGSSSTIDSRHFAEEFIRRKKLADKGLVDTTAPAKSSASPAAASGGAGGWSEVAKKGPAKEGAKGGVTEGDVGGANFRVVAAKKRGGKR